MFLMTFKNEEGRQFFLYDERRACFIGGDDEHELVHLLWQDVPLALSLPSQEVVQCSFEQLHEAIGGMPFAIYTFTGGLMNGRAWHGVERLVQS